MFQSFDTFKNSREAEVTLRCIYETMRRASHHHDIEGEESWRRKPWYHHVIKAFHHCMAQLESEKDIALDTKSKGGPPTGLPHACLSLTRLHFVCNHWSLKGWLSFIPDEGPVVEGDDGE